MLKILPKFLDSPSHRIFKRMHEALNIDKKIKLIKQFRRNGRDKSFKPNETMIGQYLPNNNETATVAFHQKKFTN
jgi:hypothetical protein